MDRRLPGWFRLLFLVVSMASLYGCGEKRPETKSLAEPSKPGTGTVFDPGSVASVANIRAAPAADPDQELAVKVKSALEADRDLAGLGIDVSASKGVVRLWGTVASADESKRATRVASSVAGVTSVNNRLAIVKGS